MGEERLKSLRPTRMRNSLQEGAICTMSETGEGKPDWDKFHQWEKEYEIARLRKLSPAEKVKILDDFYITVLKIRQSVDKMGSV